MVVVIVTLDSYFCDVAVGLDGLVPLVGSGSVGTVELRIVFVSQLLRLRVLVALHIVQRDAGVAGGVLVLEEQVVSAAEGHVEVPGVHDVGGPCWQACVGRREGRALSVAGTAAEVRGAGSAQRRGGQFGAYAVLPRSGCWMGIRSKVERLEWWEFWGGIEQGEVVLSHETAHWIERRSRCLVVLEYRTVGVASIDNPVVSDARVAALVGIIAIADLIVPRHRRLLSGASQ